MNVTHSMKQTIVGGFLAGGMALAALGLGAGVATAAPSQVAGDGSVRVADQGSHVSGDGSVRVAKPGAHVSADGSVRVANQGTR